MPADLVALSKGSADPAADIRSILEGAPRGVAGVQAEDPMRGSGILFSAGDLDGDGLVDALEDHWWEGFAAVRSATGETLWSENFGNGFGSAMPAGDLDAQGADDVIAMDIQTQGALAASRWTITFSGRRGDTGTTLWSRPYDNPWTEVGFGAGAYLDVNFAVPMGLGDVDGDGADDLLVARYHHAFVWQTLTWREVGATHAVFEVLSGRTGQVITDFHVGALNGSVYAVVVPDLSGDGRADIVSVPFTWDDDYESATGMITARRGNDGSVLWERPFSGSEPPWVGAADVTGDGRGDLLLETYDWWEDSVVLEVLSGATGTLAWAHDPGGYAVAHPAGDSDGDGGQELLVISESVDEETWEYGTAVALLHGATGAEQWSKSLGDGFAHAAGDATGDGVLDPAVTRFRYDDDTDDFMLDGPLELLSGANGETVWTREEMGDFAFLIGLDDDLDGDGSADLLRITFGPGDRDVLLGVSGATGEDLWDQPRSTGGWVFWLEAARVRDRGGADLMESGYGFTSASDFDFTGVRSGTDGALVWRERFDW